MKVCIQSGTPEGGTRVEIESHGQRLAILSSGEPFSSAGVRVEHVDGLEDRKAVRKGRFAITPFVGDPFGRDAYAILVEADGAALFYIGDLRTGAVQKLLHAAVPHVDALLIEGATVGKANSSDGFPTEADFEEKFVSMFRQTRGMPLVWYSGQNVDRIVTIYRACLRTNRQFIVDASTAGVLRAARLPRTAGDAWDRIKVFAASRKRQTKRSEARAPVDPVGPPRIAPEELAAATAGSVMVFRPALMQELEDAKCLAGARLIFSMWSGYLEYEKANPVLEWLERHGIPLYQCYTSGHAGVMDLVKLREAFPAATVVPVRARRPERFDELFGRVQRRADGEWWEIVATARRD